MRARNDALRLHSRLATDASRSSDPLAKVPPDVELLLHAYLEQSEKLFDATCALLRARPLDD